MTTHTGKNDPTTALRVKLMEVLYVPRIWQRSSSLCSQADASRAIDLCYLKGTLIAEGVFACAFTGKYVLEHQVAHLELPAMLELLVLAS
jgi:hypothetical protein